MAGATETGGMRFAATEGNIKSGYYLPKGRKVMNMIDVINYNDVERTVYVSAEIEYLPGKVPGYLDGKYYDASPATQNKVLTTLLNSATRTNQSRHMWRARRR